MIQTRRDLLRSAAGAALVPLLAGAAGAWETKADIAVIGGGVAGAYAAYRLSTARPGARVRLFETSGRIGGRLRSLAFPQAPHLIGEAGGMRFLEAHEHVFNLVDHLKLPRRQAPIETPQDRLFLRGRNIALKDRGKILFPYTIPAEEQNPASTAFLRGITRVVPDAAKMTPQHWKSVRATYRFKGRLLRDWATWALLAQLFTWEELSYFQDASGYDDFDLYGNGLGFFDYVFMGDDESKPFYSLVGGFERLPHMLADEARKHGAVIATRATLKSLHVPQRPGGAFRLVFADSNGKHSETTASLVILALPQRAINLIPDFPARDAHFAAMIDSVVPVAACKSFLLYPKPWWKEKGIRGGRSITDMPARQIYLYGSETERLPAEDAGGFGLLMSYSDATTVEYWKGLVPRPKPDAAGLSWLSGNSQLAQEIHREAGLVFQATPPEPIAACLQDWTADPFGAGWHFWRPGSDGFALAPAMLKPMASQNLFVCGEAWSLDQGWVEGALDRTEALLRTHFGLARPGWLKN